MLQLRPRHARRGGEARRGRRFRPRPGPAARPTSRRRGHREADRRDDRRRSRKRSESSPTASFILIADSMEKAELIWKNGEFVPWDEANVHVLTHGLHYGTGRLRGHPLLRDRARPGDLPPRRAPRPPRAVGRALLPPARLRDRGDPGRDQGADPPQRPAQLLHPPARIPGIRRDGPLRAERAGGGVIAVWPWGAYLGEEGKKNGIRAKVSPWRRISPDSLIPHAKASGQYLNSILAKNEIGRSRLRRGDPARPPRLGLRGHRARTSS